MFFSSTPSISVTDIAKKACDKDVSFIDVRTKSEFDSGHAKCAKNIPLNSFSQTDIENLRRVDSVYVICQSGGRSGMATKMLIAQGVKATNVSGGTLAWRAHGLPMQ